MDIIIQKIYWWTVRKLDILPIELNCLTKIMSYILFIVAL